MFCKHDWEILSERYTESQMEHASKCLPKGMGITKGMTPDKADRLVNILMGIMVICGVIVVGCTILDTKVGGTHGNCNPQVQTLRPTQ